MYALSLFHLCVLVLSFFLISGLTMSNSVLEEHNNSIKQFFSNKKKYTVILILEVLETQIKYESRRSSRFRI